VRTHDAPFRSMQEFESVWENFRVQTIVEEDMISILAGSLSPQSTATTLMPEVEESDSPGNLGMDETLTLTDIILTRNEASASLTDMSSMYPARMDSV